MENFEQACGIQWASEKTIYRFRIQTQLKYQFGTIENRLQFVVDAYRKNRE